MVARALSTPFADLAEEFLAYQKPLVSRQGFTSLEGMILRVLAWFEAEDLELTQVGIRDALGYGAYLAEHVMEDGRPYAAGTVQNYLKVVRRFFDYLVKSERMSTNPFLEVDYPRLGVHFSRNVLSEVQMHRLLRELAQWDELPNPTARARRYRVHVVAEVLYSTGLRIAEAGELREGDLDLTHRRVYIKAGKGGKPRTAFLNSFAADVLEQFITTGRAYITHKLVQKNSHTLFGVDKARLAAVVNGELEKLCLALDLPVITTHGFRHSLGTHLLRAGCDMRYIQAILGHEALGTTQIYTRVDKDDLRRSLDEFHPRQWNGRDP